MMKQAQKDLLKYSATFNDAADKIATVHNDFLETRIYFSSFVNRIRWGGYLATLVTAVVGGILAVYILGPFGLLVSLGILAVGAAAIEAVAIPLVKKKFAVIEKMYGIFSEQVNGAETLINDAKTKIQEKVPVATTTAGLKVIDLGFTDEALKNADELMQLCKDYQKQHGKKD